MIGRRSERLVHWLSAPALMVAAFPAIAHGDGLGVLLLAYVFIVTFGGLVVGGLAAAIALALRTEGWLVFWVAEGVMMVAVLGVCLGVLESGIGTGIAVCAAMGFAAFVGFSGAMYFVRGSDSARTEKAKDLIRERQRAKGGS